MKITIYGRPGCVNCARAKRILPAAEYKDHIAIFDDYDTDDATNIVTATNGNLPIIVIETKEGRLIVSMGSDGHFIKCSDGSCSI